MKKMLKVSFYASVLVGVISVLGMISDGHYFGAFGITILLVLCIALADIVVRAYGMVIKDLEEVPEELEEGFRSLREEAAQKAKEAKAKKQPTIIDQFEKDFMTVGAFEMELLRSDQIDVPAHLEQAAMTITRELAKRLGENGTKTNLASLNFVKE